ncbi:hypothetical protein D3C73_1019680 [compost metagenome]
MVGFTPIMVTLCFSIKLSVVRGEFLGFEITSLEPASNATNTSPINEDTYTMVLVI